MQLLTIAGTVGKDAVLRSTTGGDDVLGFSVAVSNGKDKDATWYDCSIWGDRARKLESHIKKGTRLTLYGRPTSRAHDGKAYLGLNVDNFTFQSSAEQRQGGGGSSDSYGSGFTKDRATKSNPDYDDMGDIPFATPHGLI